MNLLKQYLCFFASLLLASSLAAQEAIQWHNVSSGIREAEILSIGVAPWNSREIYAGTPRGIYKTLDQGVHWKKILATKGDDRSVYCIAFSGGSDSIYAGTGNGLYRSSDYGKHWEGVFQGESSGERSVFWIEPIKSQVEQLYIAAHSGVYLSEDGGKNWNRIQTLPTHSAIRRVLSHPNGNRLWVIADSGVFFSQDQGQSWERIWVSPSETIEVIQDQDQVHESEIEEFSSTQRIRHVALQFFANGSSRLLAGTSQGLLAQNGDQKSWEVFPPFSSSTLEINSVTADPQKEGTIFIGTDQGIYYWDAREPAWQSSSSGVIGQRIYELEFSKSGTQLWAATDKGVYYAEFISPPLRLEQTTQTPNFLTSQEILSRYRYEPSIEQVQQWAIVYAEVHPEKIQQWRQQAKRRAYLPEISFNLQRDRSKTIDVDRGGTNDPDRYIIGPDDKSMDVDLAISWDLADLIWNDDQTSIDVRSRLMVQLRDDILDEVTRLYFERRRLQVEKELVSSKDVRLQVAQELRLEELTAQIDALTGAEFSRYLEKNENQKL